MNLGLRLPQLRFLDHSNRPTDVEGFVPPENVYHEIHGHIYECDDIDMGDLEVFEGTCKALRYKP